MEVEECIERINGDGKIKVTKNVIHQFFQVY